MKRVDANSVFDVLRPILCTLTNNTTYVATLPMAQQNGIVQCIKHFIAMKMLHSAFYLVSMEQLMPVSSFMVKETGWNAEYAK